MLADGRLAKIQRHVSPKRAMIPPKRENFKKLQLWSLIERKAFWVAIVTMADDSNDGPILVGQTQVPRSSLFEAPVDAESAIPVAGLKPPPTDAPTDRSDDSGTALDENLSDLSDDDFERNSSQGQSVRRTTICCSRRWSICLFVLVFVAVAALVVGIIGFTSDYIDFSGNKAVQPLPPVIDDAPGMFGNGMSVHCTVDLYPNLLFFSL